ncbi:MAG: hypothetical protein PUA81_00020 [Oscillospiraceae bacterium]|nr:hypothetical protein [Oscillospiraceae bacterium]
MYIHSQFNSFINADNIIGVKIKRQHSQSGYEWQLLAFTETTETIISKYDSGFNAGLALNQIIKAIENGADIYDVDNKIERNIIPNPYQKYEQLKRKLSDLDLTAGQYEEIIKAVAEVLEL